MKDSPIGKSGLLSLALALVVGSIVIIVDSRWTLLVGVTFVLLATGMLIGARAARSRQQYHFIAEPEFTREKISPNLVVLSSAAVLAIYSAGYFRTRAAANRLVEEAAQQRIEALAPANAPPPPPEIKPDQAVTPSGAPTPTPAEPPRKKTATRAPATVRAPKPASDSQADPSTPGQQASQSGYKDGTYLGWGSCRHGDIQAGVIIKRGQIVDVGITQCQTRYSCSVIKSLPGEVLDRQSVNVDLVSGATESAYAFHDAVAQALSKAQGQQAPQAPQAR